MKKYLRMGLWFSFAFLFFIKLSWSAQYVPGEVIVKYKAGAFRTQMLMQPLYEETGILNVQYIGDVRNDLEKLTLQKGISVKEAVNLLESSDLVEYAQPNYIWSIPELARKTPGMPRMPCIPGFKIPNCDPNAPMPCLIPGIPFPPGCQNPGAPSHPSKRPVLKKPPAEVIPPKVDPDLAKAWGLKKIGATRAWKNYRGGKNIIVAVIDTGIDYNHKDLSFNMWRNPKPTKKDVVGFDFIHNDGLPYDDQGHGTHTAGTVGAVGGNGIGISGVTQKVQLMAVKFLTSSGSGTTANAIQAIRYAVDHGAKILSNSWGGKSPTPDKALGDAISYAQKKGVLVIAAAGNDGSNNDVQPVYPAAYPQDNIIAVAATDDGDHLAFFSNYGEKTVDLAAPGVNIYSTKPQDQYQKHSGTSMACPHVSGAAALIWSKHPNWNYTKVKKELLKTVTHLEGLEGKTVSAGRLNVYGALTGRIE